MESDLGQDQDQGQQNKKVVKIFDRFPFLEYIKGRLVSYIEPETKKQYVGHVAMYYRDTGRIRIDWDNGATTYHDFTTQDSKWLFHPVVRKVRT
jgi:hypothetical protein